MPVYLRLLEIYEHELTMRWVLKFGERKLNFIALKEARNKEKKLFEEARKKVMNIRESELSKAARLGQLDSSELKQDKGAYNKSKSQVEVKTSQPSKVPPLKLSFIKQKTVSVSPSKL